MPGMIAFFENSSKKFMYILYFIFLMIMSVFYFHHNRGYALDDSFITFRYAYNLAHGYGLSFNPGERYYGTTAAGYAVLLSIGYSVANVFSGSMSHGNTIDVPDVSTVYSTASIFLVAALLPLLAGGARPLLKWLSCAFMAVFLFTANPFNDVVGHETYFFLACAFAGTVLVAQFGRYAWGAVVLAIAVTIRPDAILFGAFVPFISVAMLRNRTDIVRGLASFYAPYTIVILIWSAYVFSQFGTVIPGTLVAKQAQVVLNLWPIYNPATILKYVRNEQIGLLSYFLLGLGLVFYVARLISDRKTFLKSSYTVICFSWGLFAFVSIFAYWIVIKSSFWNWYGVPLIFSMAIISFVGWVRSQPLLERFARSARTLDYSVAVGALAALCLAIGPFGRWASTNHTWPHSSAYSEIVDFLHKNAPNGATIQMSEPGSIGYHLGPKYHMVDELGLISPGVAQALIRKDYAWSFNKWHARYLICTWNGVYSGCYHDRLTGFYDKVGDFNLTFWRPAGVTEGAKLEQLKAVHP